MAPQSVDSVVNINLNVDVSSFTKVSSHQRTHTCTLLLLLLCAVIIVLQADEIEKLVSSYSLVYPDMQLQTIYIRSQSTIYITSVSDRGGEVNKVFYHTQVYMHLDDRETGNEESCKEKGE